MAHHGVLLLDELPEFQRPVLEALRQPLEDRVVVVAARCGSPCGGWPRYVHAIYLLEA